MANRNSKPKEGETAKMIEEQTAKIPSDVYLWAAVGTMALSAALFFTKKKNASIFFGQWAPSLLIIGLYNKLVKLEGHDSEDKENTGRENKGQEKPAPSYSYQQS